MIIYPDEVVSDIISAKIKSVFKSSKVSELKNRKGEKEFLISLNRKKNLTSMKKLKWKAFNPIIRPVVSSDFFNHFTENNHDNIIDVLSSFLSSPNSQDVKLIQHILQEKLSNVNATIHSEYLLSTIMNYFLIKLGQKKKWLDILLFSIDSKMEYVINNELRNFRCDTILIWGERLILIEYKFRFNRNTEMGKVALNCIQTKKYSERVLNHLRKNYYSLFKNLNKVVEMGIGYSVKNSKINLDIQFCQNDLEDAELV
jgi:hypothetical protein